MDVTEPDCQRAMANIAAFVDRTKRFPGYVFRGTWTVFRFFDSDWVFTPEFVEYARSLVVAADASCAVIGNLDSDEPGQQFIFDQRASAALYAATLGGPAPDRGFLISVDRFACVSDSNAWSIYCERANEIAVIAFRSKADWQKASSVTASLRAEAIATAIDGPLSYGFSRAVLTNSWREQLLSLYRSSC